MSRTIEQILVDIKAQGYNQLPGFHGKQLEFEFATREKVLSNGRKTQGAKALWNCLELDKNFINVSFLLLLIDLS